MARGVGTVIAHGEAQNQGPSQNADVVGVGQRADRVGHQVHQQSLQHFDNAAWRRGRHIARFRKNQHGRKSKAGNHCDQGCRKRTDEVQNDNRFDVGLVAFLMLRDGGQHQCEHQNRRDGFQRPDEQAAEQSGRDTRLRREYRQRDTQSQADDDLLHEADAVDGTNKQVAACHSQSFSYIKNNLHSKIKSRSGGKIRLKQHERSGNDLI